MAVSMFHGDLVDSNRIIYTPSSFAKNNLIYLQEIGELQAKLPHTSKRHNLISYLFFVVQEGSGTLEYDGSSFSLVKDDCIFIDCRRTYSHRSSENLWKLKWIHFYGSNMNGIYEKYVERGGQPLFQSKNKMHYDKILTHLYEVAASNAYLRDMQIYEKLTSLLTLLMEDSWNPSDHKHEFYRKCNLQNIKDYLDVHYHEKIVLDDLAEQFYINKFHLTRIFKEQFGVSVINYLMHVRITHAKQLLRFTDYSIERIGQECGMNDANYFSRMFKKIEGISPGQFRKMW
jgi:AraC-like DNA-binding protein